MAYTEEVLLLNVCIVSLSLAVGHFLLTGCCRKQRPTIAALKPRVQVSSKTPSVRPTNPVVQQYSSPGGSNTPGVSNTPDPVSSKLPPKTITVKHLNMKKKGEMQQKEGNKKEEGSKKGGKKKLATGEIVKKFKDKKKTLEEKTPIDELDPEPDAPSLGRTQDTTSQKAAHDDDTVKNVESLKDDKFHSEG